MNTFARMIERMEDLVLSGTGIPLTPLTVINSEKLVPLLDRIRESLPEEIKQAHRLNEQREQILGETQHRASQMLQDAKQQAEQLLSESELMHAIHFEAQRVKQQILAETESIKKQAREEADALKRQAAEEARQIRDGAEQYAVSVLNSLDKNLMDIHAVVRNGQKHLRKVKHDAGFAPVLAPGFQATTQIPVTGQSASYGPDLAKQLMASPAQSHGSLDRLVTPEVAKLEAARQALAPLPKMQDNDPQLYRQRAADEIVRQAVN